MLHREERALPSQKRRTRRSFGAVRKLPSGRFQASYLDPDGVRRPAPTTFTTKGDADTWLSIQRAALETGAWRGDSDETTVGEYAEAWLKTLTVRPRTAYNYQRSISRWILPTFGTIPMRKVTPVAVRRWVAAFPEDKPAARAQAYTVLHRIFRDATDEGIIPENPVRVRGASEYRVTREGQALTLDGILAIAQRMPEAEQLAVVLAGVCALRPGEVLALRRRDVDLEQQVLHIRETASATIGGASVGPTKTEGSTRDVHFPAGLTDALRDQIAGFAAPGPRGHLFPRRVVSPSDPIPYRTFSGHFNEAARQAGIPDVRPHDLRHSGATLAAATGATVAELMARLGHTSPTVAMRYQHAVRERDKSIADTLGAALAVAHDRQDDK